MRRVLGQSPERSLAVLRNAKPTGARSGTASMAVPRATLLLRRSPTKLRFKGGPFEKGATETARRLAPRCERCPQAGSPLQAKQASGAWRCYPSRVASSRGPPRTAASFVRGSSASKGTRDPSRIDELNIPSIAPKGASAATGFPLSERSIRDVRTCDRGLRRRMQLSFAERMRQASASSPSALGIRRGQCAPPSRDGEPTPTPFQEHALARSALLAKHASQARCASPS